MKSSEAPQSKKFAVETSERLPITLGLVHPRLVGQVQPAIAQVVHERDHFICRCCGFGSRRYQQTLVLGDNWRDVDTIATTCIFCQQCFSLDLVSKMRSGVLIYFPEVSQGELNRLGWELYVGRQSSRTSRLAKACLDMLMGRRAGAVKQAGTDDPHVLADLLRDATSEVRQAVLQSRLSSIRLFPLDRRIVTESHTEFNQWPQILAYVRSANGPYRIDKRNRLPLLEEFSSQFM